MIVKHKLPRFVRSWTGDDRDERVRADYIQQLWHARGHTEVRIWVEQVLFARAGDKNRYISITRSNLINGLPPSVHATIVADAGLAA